MDKNVCYFGLILICAALFYAVASPSGAVILGAIDGIITVTGLFFRFKRQ